MKNMRIRVIVLSVIVVAAFGIFGAAHVYAAPPANFQTTQIVGSGLNGPSGIGIAPDGRIFILERTGAVKIYKGGLLLPEPFVAFDVSATGDRGLIGIAFDPNFTVNKYVYFYYTGTDLLNHVVRYSAAGDTATAGPVYIYQTTSPSQLLHVGGSIDFGPDGKLYIAVGDNGNSANAQHLFNPHGKILRINKDGTIPSDNPFVGTSGALPEIWAYGLRNPWRFQFDAATGFLYDGDVGDASWEEINRIERGGNYGWPTCEGVCSNPSFINPIYAYSHDGSSSAVTAGPVNRGTMFPESYAGRLFFGDYARGFIKTAQLDASGDSTGVYDFDNNAGSVVDLKFAPDGSLYYITYYPGRLYRISYSTSNHVPVANATSDVTKGLEPLTVNFSSAGSFDPDGDSIVYSWNLGDGTSTTTPNPTKTYSARGAYTVDLSVSDGVNLAHAVPIVIQVGLPPVVSIGTPINGSLYRAGDTINFSASAVDGVGNDINDGSISTEVLFHHGTHIHPFLGPVIGRVGSFTIPTSGEAAADTWFEIRVTATDTNGLSTTEAVNIYPRTSTMTFTTAPATGLQFKLDGAPITTPYSVQGVVGFQRTIEAISPQILEGTSYGFVSWSDSGATLHTITTPETATTFTATYEAGSPACGSIGNSAFTGCYYNNQDLTSIALTRTDPVIDFDWGGGSPDPALEVDTFSARWKGSFNFNESNYQFTITGDDGIRLYVDDALILDRWIDQGPTTYQPIVAMSAGTHTITMEYYEAYGGAVARLSWEAITNLPDAPACDQIGSNEFFGCYYDTTDLSNLVLTRSDPAVDFDWGGGSPHPVVAPDSFSASWQGDFIFQGSPYRFTVTADDGFRLYLDDALILDHWIDQGATTYVALESLTAGVHRIKLEYYENSGGAVVELSWAVAADSTPPIITAIAVISVTNNRATISWATDEPANSTVEYGRTQSLGSTVASQVLETNHRVMLTGLRPRTKYFYRIMSADASGNMSASSVRTFFTR